MCPNAMRGQECGCEECQQQNGAVSPAVRRATWTLAQLLPAHMADPMKLLKQMNVVALQEGLKPVGPDMNVDTEYLVRYMLNALVGGGSLDDGNASGGASA